MEKENKIAVIGLCYLGLPLTLPFSKNYKVVGCNVNEKRVWSLKEDCADTFNTKLKDIAEGLDRFLCEISIFDPYISENPGTNFINNPFDAKKKYDSIIIAVSDHEFVNYTTTTDFKQLSKGKLVLLDIKGIYNESSWKF